MSDSWFKWHIAPDDNPADGCDPQEASALKDYLRSTIITAEEAARAIVLPIEDGSNPDDDGLSKENAEPEFYRLWNLIIDALKALPEHRIKIIGLLKAIQNLPPTVHSTSQSQGHDIHWANLPGFGHLWSDLKVSGNWRRSATQWDPEQRENVRQDYIQQANLEAELVMAGIAGVSLQWGLGTICDALERQDAVLDFEVPAANEWFQIAGKRILEHAGGEVIGYLRERDLWKQAEARKPRWMMWRERLGWIAEDEELGEKVTAAADMAYDAIDAAAGDWSRGFRSQR